MAKAQVREISRALDEAATLSGKPLAELAAGASLLLVFLRHSGCTFCREALGDLARNREEIESSGVRIVLVDMGDSEAIGEQVERYGLSGVERISDRGRALYKAFGLGRGSWFQLMGPTVLWRGLQAGVWNGHGIGKPSADARQMPGLFLIGEAGIIRRFRHRSAADRPDYVELCSTATAGAATSR